MANTTNFNFELIDFDTIPWHTKDHNNWRLADAVFAQYISISGVKGVWTNSLAIGVDDKYVDSELGTIWTAELAHTSASSGTFAADRTANSSYWSTFSITQAFKGTWAINTAYSVNEFVVSGNKYAVCQTAHTSGATTFEDDSVYWIVLIDGTTIIDSCTTQATLAETHATTSSNWAIKTDAAVSGSDYSAKEYAQGTQASTGGSSKSWAQDADEVNGASTNDRSAKNWAQGASMTGSTLGGSAKDWAQLAEDSQVNGSEYSAKHYSAKASASASAASSSASAAAAGQLYSTIVNQTASTLSPAISADGTYYLCDTSSNSITVTLPEIGANEGKKFSFQKTHASNSLIFQRTGSDTLNGSASNITLTDVDSQILFVCDNNSPDNWVGTNLNQIQAGTGLTKTGSVLSVTAGGIGLTQIATAAKTECIAIACSDETTDLEAGVAKTTFHMPYAFTLTGVKAGVTTAPAGSVLTVDINEAGSTILTTKLTIDAGEKTSATAATAPVIGGAGPALAADALMTVDIDGVGSSTAGTGLKIYLIGYQT
tara:strand:+ start:5342 stop:6970 length:1629 start_codon:yes stop_codon:yes gene_type:complete